MDLAFESKLLRTICESEDQARLELGFKVAEKLKHRLADLRAATTIDEIVVGQMHSLDAVKDLLRTLEFCDGYQIVFSANHNKNPISKSGKIAWKKVYRIKILRIERKHG